LMRWTMIMVASILQVRKSADLQNAHSAQPKLYTA